MIKTFINRPVFTTMFILVFVVFGLWSYPKLGADLYPDVDLRRRPSPSPTKARRRRKWRRSSPNL